MAAEPQSIETYRPVIGSPGHGPKGGNGDGGVFDHRLNDLERRVGRLEDKIDSIGTICTRIETKMDSLATTTFIWMIFAGTLGTIVVSFIGHIILRYFTPS